MTRTPSPAAADEAVVATLDELEKWRRRVGDLEGELGRARRQLSYYESLAAEMKRELAPAGVRDLLLAISR